MQVFIIGGGISGIAAAVKAIEEGLQPVILESTPSLGGRAKSHPAKGFANQLDNGQHAFSNAYSETINLLKTLGSDHLVHWQPALSIDYRFEGKRHFHFRSWPLPAPFHFILPLLIKAPLTRQDRHFLFRFGMQLRKTDPQHLKSISVAEWLSETGEAPFLTNLLWEPLTLATLNTSVFEANAFLLYQVLHQAFLASSRKSGLGIPLCPLSDLFGKPASSFLESQNTEIHLNSSVKNISRDEKGLTLHTRRADYTGKAVISTLPPKALGRILFESKLNLDQQFAYLEAFEYSPIITIYLSLNKALPGTFPTALTASPLQWIFELDPFEKKLDYTYAMIISAADQIIGYEQSDIIELVRREIRRFYQLDIKSDLGIISLKIVKEKQATFRQTVAAEAKRPQPTTEIKGFYLAGDWTDTELPATIEGAVISGRKAVEQISRDIKSGAL